MMSRAWYGWFLCLLIATPLLADKVIMKDGKIYEGKIIAETDGDVLIRTPPVEPRPKLLPSDEILSVLRDPIPQEPIDLQRYRQLEFLVNGNVFSSRHIRTDPAASLWLGGGIRLHPALEFDAGFDWKPAITGAFAATNGTTVRAYESFSALTGGFSLRLFPLYARRWKIEPYLVGGYEWSRLIMKGSDDVLNGGGFKFGVGSSWPLHKNLFLETQFLYRRMRYNRLFFLHQQGDADPEVMNDSYFFGTGLSYHFF